MAETDLFASFVDLNKVSEENIAGFSPIDFSLNDSSILSLGFDGDFSGFNLTPPQSVVNSPESSADVTAENESPRSNRLPSPTLTCSISNTSPSPSHTSDNTVLNDVLNLNSTAEIPPKPFLPFPFAMELDPSCSIPEFIPLEQNLPPPPPLLNFPQFNPLNPFHFQPPPPFPMVNAPTDISQILKSSTATACQQLLNEPAKRKPGRKRKSETESQKTPSTPVSNFQVKPEEMGPMYTLPNKVPIFPTNGMKLMKPPIDDKTANAIAKRQERLIKNREAADQSRKRKREHLQMLESHAQTLIAENEMLKKKVVELEMRAAVLAEENKKLKKLEDADGKKRKLDDGSKAVGAVFMVFLFSFAFYFMPTQRPLLLEGHRSVRGIAARPHEDSSRVFDLIAPSRPLIDGPQQPASPPVPVPVPSIPAIPKWPEMTSSFNIPVSNITEFLAVLANEKIFSKESRDQIRQLNKLFEPKIKKEDIIIEVPDVIIKPEPGLEPHETSLVPKQEYEEELTVSNFRFVPYKDVCSTPRLSLLTALQGSQHTTDLVIDTEDAVLRLDLEIVGAELIRKRAGSGVEKIDEKKQRRKERVERIKRRRVEKYRDVEEVGY